MDHSSLSVASHHCCVLINWKWLIIIWVEEVVYNAYLCYCFSYSSVALSLKNMSEYKCMNYLAIHTYIIFCMQIQAYTY